MLWFHNRYCKTYLQFVAFEGENRDSPHGEDYTLFLSHVEACDAQMLVSNFFWTTTAWNIPKLHTAILGCGRHCERLHMTLIDWKNNEMAHKIIRNYVFPIFFYSVRLAQLHNHGHFWKYDAHHKHWIIENLLNVKKLKW